MTSNEIHLPILYPSSCIAKGKGLASKLAAKVKAGSLVPDTPDREKQKERSRYTEPTIQDTPSGSRQQSKVSHINFNSISIYLCFQQNITIQY